MPLRLTETEYEALLANLPPQNLKHEMLKPSFKKVRKSTVNSKNPVFPETESRINKNVESAMFVAAMWHFPSLGLFIVYLPLILFMIGALIIHSFLPGLHLKWSVLIMSGILLAWVVWVLFGGRFSRHHPRAMG